MGTVRMLLLFLPAFAVISCSPGSNGPSDGGGDGGLRDCESLGLADSDDDGIPDRLEGDDSVDTDSDGRPDYLDDDSDNDDFSDTDEAAMAACDSRPRDSDGDGTYDFRDIDSDGNGIHDRYELPTDTDEDGLPNWQDVDDDGDGLDDATEIGDDLEHPLDTDGDGTPDFWDDDSDGDGISDSVEGTDDTDGDGVPAYRDDDSDGDGWSDEDEYRAGMGGEPADTDGDGTPDFLDLDSDNDLLSDAEELAHGTSPTAEDTDGDTFSDYLEVELGSDPLDAESVPGDDPCNPSECVPEELCGEVGSGDGLDNNCNGEVDEICPCTPGETRNCFAGPPAARGEGACADGIEHCNEFGLWDDCVGGVFPEPEVCDGSDNDCDGLLDEELTDCDTPLECTGTISTVPISVVELDGTAIYDGPYESWLWEVFCPATVDVCPTPDAPADRDTSIYLLSSGSYRVRATVGIDGEIYTCGFTIEVGGDGLRVELTWDTQGNGRGNTDVDLHLHQPGAMTDFFTLDDCFYENCKASSYTLDWGLPPTTDLTACENAPHGEGALWTSRGDCANPRLDVDVVMCLPGVTDARNAQFCAPENINVDNPEPDRPYRIMVNYYSALFYGGVTHPTVNIYCGGSLRSTLGGEDVELVHGGLGGSMNDVWLVADVVFRESGCAIDCEITPITNDDDTPWIQRGAAFGPDWSY